MSLLNILLIFIRYGVLCLIYLTSSRRKESPLLEILHFSQICVAVFDWESGMAIENLDKHDFIKDFLIPSSLLEQDTEIQRLPSKPEHPVLVFINSKSGGQLGGELIVTYRSILNKEQVKN